MHYIFIQSLPTTPVLIDAINSTFWIAWNRVTNQLNDCHKTCRDLKIILGGGNLKVTQCIILNYMFCNFSSFQMEDNKTAITLYFEQRVVISEEHYFYSSLSLTAEIGGYLGLLLGVSFLNFAAWVAAIIQRKIHD